MGKAWVKDRKKDPYYRQAKAGGYRSRAAYKLLQIQERFSVIRPGDTVVDLGAAPGGWSQVVRELGAGRVVAVDRVFIRPIGGVEILRVDLREGEAITAFVEEAAQSVDVVLSDMAPHLSGNRSLDQAKSIDLAEHALLLAQQALRKGGHFVSKVFQGDMYPAFRRRVKGQFARAKDFSPPASPRGSAEIYLVAKGWRGPDTH